MPPVSTSRRGIGLVSTQLLICAFAGLFLAFAPPVSGEILLLPTSGAGAGALAEAAIAQGARLIARGPVAGSLVVHGSGHRLARYFIGHGVIAISARASGCGTTV